VIDLSVPPQSAKDVQQKKAKSFFAAMGDLLGDEPA